eukprot:4722867-Pyramimonas_sp.AAC.1
MMSDSPTPCCNNLALKSPRTKVVLRAVVNFVIAPITEKKFACHRSRAHCGARSRYKIQDTMLHPKPQ